MLCQIWKQARFAGLKLNEALGGATVGQAQPALIPLDDVLEALGISHLPAAGTEEKITLPTLSENNFSELSMSISRDNTIAIAFTCPEKPWPNSGSGRKVQLQGRVVYDGENSLKLALTMIDWFGYPGSRFNPKAEDAHIFLDSIKKCRDGDPVGSFSNPGWRFYKPEPLEPRPAV